MKNKKQTVISMIAIFVFLLIVPTLICASGCGKTNPPGYIENDSSTSIVTGSEDRNASEEDDQEESKESGEKDNSNNEANTDVKEITQKPDQQDIIDGFNKLVDENKSPEVLIEHIDKNLELMESQTLEGILEKLEYSQRAYQEIATQYLFEGDGQQKLLQYFNSEDDFILANIGRIQDDNLKKDIEKIFLGGFKFINLEGSYYPIIDYGYLKKYSLYLDDRYNEYIIIMAIESDDIYTRDAALTISWDELAVRMVASEDYLIQYPEENPQKIAIGKLLLGYFTSYLYGQNNTPNRDWSTNIVYDEVMKSYKRTIQDNEDSNALLLLKDYYDALILNDSVLSENILNRVKRYIITLVKSYALDSQYIIKEQLKYLDYPSDEAVYGSIRLLNGLYSEKGIEGSAPGLNIRLSEFVAVGDLNDDSMNDAAAIIIAEPKDESRNYYLHAINNGGFYIYSIANSFLGDMVKIEKIEIREGLIYLDMLTHKQDDQKCCPTEEVTRIFKLSGYELTEIQE